MPGSVKVRLVPVILAALLALAIAGCGGGGDSGGGEAELAAVAPPKTPLYIEFALQPEGETKANIEALAQELAGVSDLGGLIESELESSAADEGEEVDIEKDVKPWLGKQGAFIFPEYKNEDFNEAVAAIQVTDAGEAEDFIDAHAKSHGEPDENGSYEGVDFKIEKDDGQSIGVVGEELVLADNEALFKQVVDASNGESLADEGSFTDAIANAPEDSAADVYVDIGGMIEQAGKGIDPETKLFLESAGIEPEEATAVASLVPGSQQIEIDFSTDVAKQNVPSGDASKMLGSLPADSLFAFATPEFGKHFQEEIDQIDEQGIPNKVPPHQLKKALKQKGIDLESIIAPVGDVGLFVDGSNQGNLGGALVLETEDSKQAANTVSNLGLFLQASGMSGITRLSGGEATGFVLRNREIGPQPVVVGAKGNRIGIGYGLRSVPAALSGNGETLAETPQYEEAADALGSTPISAFVEGHAALRLASGLVPPGEEGFRQAKRYLTKVDYVAVGSEGSGEVTTAKLIVGLGK